MLKLLINDYISNFKPAFLKTFKNNGWYLLLYMLIMLPVLLRDDVQIIRYYGVMLPFVFGAFFSIMYPTRLHKNMFMCPMSDEDIKKYIKFSFWFKIMLIEVIYITINLILTLTGKIKFNIFLCDIIMIFALFVTCNISYDKLSYSDRFDKKRRNKGTCFSEWIAIIFGIINIVIIGSFDFVFENEKRLTVVLVISSILVQLIFSAVFFMKRYKKIIERASDFEWSYGMVKDENNN